MSTPESFPSRLPFRVRMLSITGIAIFLAALGLDLLPGARSGLHSLQLLAILLGLALALVPLALRRQSLLNKWNTPLKVVVIAGVTLAALEVALVVIGYGTFFPQVAPKSRIRPAPWWTCEDPACHYIQSEMATACDNGQMSGRSCLINAQGFHDSQDFVASADLVDRSRILVLGDSFTFGDSADLGHSYVETIESNLPEAVVWNTGIFGVGTNQSLAAYQMFAPVLEPHITVYGFYVNDLFDNLFPVDGYYLAIDDSGNVVKLQQYRLDPWGTVTKLDPASLNYYRFRGVDVPANEVERVLGATRLGSLLLRAVDALGKNLGLAQQAQFNLMLDLTRGYLRDLRDESAAQGSGLLVMLIPSKSDVTRPSKNYNLAVEIIEELGISYFLPIEHLDAELDYAPDWHWNNRGHGRVGAKLSECIASFLARGDFEECVGVVNP